MKFAMIGAVLITLPALIALIASLFLGYPWFPWLTFAALASLAINTLPFLAAGFLMRRQHQDADLSH